MASNTTARELTSRCATPKHRAVTGPHRHSALPLTYFVRSPKPTLITGLTVLLGVLILGARPALAHEITVATVIAAAEGTGTDPAAVVDGLRLAIDQSPDVGHAATSDGGDHLGGIDVELTVFDDLASPAEAEDAARSAVADGAGIVVVLGDSATLAAASAAVPPEQGFLVAVLAGPGELDATLTLPVLRQVGALDTEAARAFSASFEATFGRSPSESAALGYDIGQLLDVLLETSGSMPDTSSLQNVSAAVQARLTTTSLADVDPKESILPRSNDGGGQPNAIPPLVLVGAALITATLITTLVRKRHRSPTG